MLVRTLREEQGETPRTEHTPELVVHNMYEIPPCPLRPPILYFSEIRLGTNGPPRWKERVLVVLLPTLGLPGSSAPRNLQNLSIH